MGEGEERGGEHGLHEGRQPDAANRNVIEEHKIHHGGSFQKYMRGKIQKLDDQFREAASATLAEQEDPALRHLFKGISIHVNGYTEPSHADLKRMMRVYGGSFQNYYSRTSVSHIVCSTLPDAKVKQFEKEKGHPPIVRPEWITESIRARKVLPIGDFILECVRPGGPGQQTLQWGPKTMPMQQHDKPTKYDAMRLSKAQAIAKRLRQECQLLKGPPKSSRDDPNFIESFYQASRLHFIGTWKTRLEKLMRSGIAHQSPKPNSIAKDRVVIHVDMDCFFASVAEASHPEFKGLPLAVCHSNAKGSGEISSANYEARSYGIHASMFMGRAKELCPMLVVVPYEFEKYEVVSESMYRILLKYTSVVQAISCDEAYLDVTGLGDPMEIASRLRADIEKETSCCASAGIASNMLLSRIATAKAKPNGEFYLKPENALGELACLDIEELPGIGWRTGAKLRDAGFNTIADIQMRSKSDLQTVIGKKLGCLIYDYAFGRDDRQVVASSVGSERKSVGAEINWGIRFQSQTEAESFLRSLSEQIYDRLQQLGLKGKSITLKIKKKRQGATEPRKFLGMGICDSMSRSTNITGNCTVQNIYNTSLPLLKSLRLQFSDIRGMGLSVTKLETTDVSSPRSLHGRGPINLIENVGKHIDKGEKRLRAEDAYHLKGASIDQGVLSELPRDIREEIENEYGLKGRSLTKHGQQITNPSEMMKSKHPKDVRRQGGPFVEYDPLRMSQVDTSVLHELPLSLQQEIIKSIDPFHNAREKSRIIKRSKSSIGIDQTKVQGKSVQELESDFRTLKMTLPPELHHAADLLHDGNPVGFLAALEIGLSKTSQTSINNTNLAILFEIISCECRSDVSSMSKECQWILYRGIKRVFSKNVENNADMSQYQFLVGRLMQVIQDKHNITFN